MKINTLAYRFIHADGYGRYAMQLIAALVRLGVNIWPGTTAMLEMPGWMRQLSGYDPSRLTLSIMPPHNLPYVPGRQVNLTMYEANRVPEDWAGHINEKATHLIVPADWLVEVFEKQGVEVPIRVIPGGVDVQEFPILPQLCRPNRPFTYLVLGDRGSRKGIDIAWSAFYKAFGDSKDVRLIIKTRAGGLDFLNLSNSDPRLSIWREDVQTMADVYAQIDCFVFATKGEGWGMPPRECAAMGVPVICTQYSGTADCASYAIPITNYRMQNSPIDGKGQWVRPDLDEVIDHMRWVYDNWNEAKARALIGAQWLRDNQTWDHSARAHLDFLEREGVL